MIVGCRENSNHEPKRASPTMDGPHAAPENRESERRYRDLRDAVADYHYHVQVEFGGILCKLHGTAYETITGFKPEE